MIGAVDDYERHQGGTTYHLHFDMQVPTRDGWIYVNPYMTLVASYERLIGARPAEQIARQLAGNSCGRVHLSRARRPPPTLRRDKRG